jgi:hypothetical protein
MWLRLNIFRFPRCNTKMRDYNKITICRLEMSLNVLLFFLLKKKKTVFKINLLSIIYYLGYPTLVLCLIFTNALLMYGLNVCI